MPDPTHPILAETAQTVAAKARAPQIRPRLQEACRAIVSEGLSIKDAALRSGMTHDSLMIALRKPHVRAFLAHVKAAWMDSRTSKAWLNIADLADSACSEDVRLKANRVFLEAAGELGGNANDGANLAKTLVQIIVNQGRDTTQLPASQMRGVIEAPAWRPVSDSASDSDPVGRADLGREDDA